MEKLCLEKEIEKTGQITLKPDELFILFKFNKNRSAKPDASWTITELVPISEIGCAADILKEYYELCIEGVVDSSVENAEKEEQTKQKK